jgi:hypothetical protein
VNVPLPKVESAEAKALLKEFLDRNNECVKWFAEQIKQL